MVTSAATGLLLSPDFQFILKAVAVFLAIMTQTWALALQESVTHDVAAPDPGRSPTRPWRERIAGFLRDYYIYLVLIAVVVVLSVANLDRFALFERGNFLSENNIVNILRASAPLLTLAGAFTLLMVSGYIDLSVGSAMSLSAVVYALLAINGVPFLPAVGLALVLGVGPRR